MYSNFMHFATSFETVKFFEGFPCINVALLLVQQKRLRGIFLGIQSHTSKISDRLAPRAVYGSDPR